MVYKTKGVCAQGIEFEIDDNKKVHNIKFTGGCSGNTQGVAQLAEGMDADEVISVWKASAADSNQLHVQISLQKPSARH